MPEHLTSRSLRFESWLDLNLLHLVSHQLPSLEESELFYEPNENEMTCTLRKLLLTCNMSEDEQP